MSNPPDPDSALLAWIVLGRVHRGGVRKLGDEYLDHNRPVPGYLVETVAELDAAGLLVLADPDPIAEATQRVTATDVGRARYAVLCQQQRAYLSTTESRVCRRLGVPGTPALPDVQELRWARCSGDGRLHAFEPADVARAAGRRHITALCGYLLATEDLAGKVGPGRGASVAIGPFPGAPFRTRRMRLRIPGSPRVFPVGQLRVVVAGLGVHGVGMVLPR